MFDRIDVQQPADLFLPMNKRTSHGVFFVRIHGWNDQVRDCLWQFHEETRRRGVIIGEQLQNPDGMQINYLVDSLGSEFIPNESFIQNALAKWLPAMREQSRKDCAQLLCAQFEALKEKGKSESMLKNLYMKLMCWLYYKFSRLMPLLDGVEPPRLLYVCEDISSHEVLLLRLLSGIGSDILLVMTTGEDKYLRHDPESQFSQPLFSDASPFPKEFSLKGLRLEMSQKQPVPDNNPTYRQPDASTQPTKRKIDPLTYFPKPSHNPCTNAWMEIADITSILTPGLRRGKDSTLYYNAFIRVTGVKDKITFPGELHQFYQRLINAGRPVVIVDEGLSAPNPEEINAIRRRNYHTTEEMIVDLANNLPIVADTELQRMLQRAFVMSMMQVQEGTLNRKQVSAVYLLCWIRRWHRDLFQEYKSGNTPCFILMGGCKNKQEALYPLFLSWLPVDVLILTPDLSQVCVLQDERLLELKGDESLRMLRFPRDAGSLQMSTVAAHAEEELNDKLYRDSGIYRNMQFQHAESMTLRTTLDEMFILWDQELRYRTGFATEEQMVTMPVIYAKISGVNQGDTLAYWQKVRRMAERDAFLCRSLPMIQQSSSNPYQPLSLRSLRNGILRRNALKEDRNYPFGIIREEMQNHILDKIQLMLDRRLIKGTFESGIEYTVVATILNMDKKLIRLLQGFDFTQNNPKAVFIATGDTIASIEDTILITFLNLVGFDVAIFVPTGYQAIEQHLNDNYPIEHQAGQYMYELEVPDLDTLPKLRKHSWLENLFKRGN